MYAIILPWHEFNVSLTSVSQWVAANHPEGYCGNSADNYFTIWYSSEPAAEVVDLVSSYWSGLTHLSEEAVKYVSQATIQAAIEAARADAVTKSWDSLSVAQKKLIAGVAPTREELGL